MRNSFLQSTQFAVVGASSNRAKYGNKVLRKYLDNGMKAIPVHPKESEIEGVAVQQLEDIPDKEHTGVSIITPPAVTMEVVENARKLGYTNFWLQPGAESKEVMEKVASMEGIHVIAGGPCVLVSIDRGEHKKANI